MTANDYVTDLQTQGRYTFTVAQARAALEVSDVAAQAALRRLKKKGAIAVPARGFHVIVPPEYRRLGCPPASEFVPDLMTYLGAPYYAGLLTAAEIYGAAHHKPQVFQVITDRNRRSAGAGGVRIVFIAKAGIAETPTREKVTEHGYLRVSTPEATAFDLVTYVGHAGGLDNVVTVLAELAEQLAPEELARVARLQVSKVSVQRLGFLLELAGHSAAAEPLASLVKDAVPPVAPLQAGAMRGSRRDRKWRLAVNAEVGPDV